MRAQLLGKTPDELKEIALKAGLPAFAGKQLAQWLYVRKVRGIDEMTNISKVGRERLKEEYSLGLTLPSACQVSSDGTKKYLFPVGEGNAVEAVMIPDEERKTLCVSSQAGCRMGCVFCASGVSGLERNLTAGEIADQVAAMSRDTGERIGHIVVMGTGEPFDNYDELLRAIRILHDENGLNIGLRNITVSTCGLLSKIQRFAEDMPQVNLAVSLHAADDETRRKLMPVAAGYDMRRLMEVCRRTAERTHRRITFEYALISGVNDSLEDARRLVSLLKGMLCHVNLIPLNDVSEKQYRGSARQRAQLFASALKDKGIEVTVRRELGSDISAACGQLRLAAKKDTPPK